MSCLPPITTCYFLTRTHLDATDSVYKKIITIIIQLLKWSRLFGFQLNAFGNSTNFISSPNSRFHGRMNASTGRDIGSFTSKEQKVLHRAGKHVTHALRMHSRWAVGPTYKRVFWPVIIHVVHQLVRSKIRLRFSARKKDKDIGQ